MLVGRTINAISINRSFGSPEKKFSINSSKANTRFCFSLHYNGGNIYLFLNGKEIFNFKSDDKDVNLPTQFCLGSISNGFGANDSRELSLKGNVYNSAVDCNT